jgi:hypothetical protein
MAGDSTCSLFSQHSGQALQLGSILKAAVSAKQGS